MKNPNQSFKEYMTLFILHYIYLNIQEPAMVDIA